MKNGLIVIGLIAGLASCGGEEASSGGASTEGVKIAYYVQDSISTNLKYFMESQDEITVLEEGLNGELAAFQAEYQRLGGEYQSKMAQGLLSPDGQKFYENKIRKIELDITSLQETEGADLQDKAMKFQESFLEKLEKSAKDYADKNGINLFLAKEKIGVVLYADSSMDVTMDFIKFMNDAEKGSAN